MWDSEVSDCPIDSRRHRNRAEDSATLALAVRLSCNECNPQPSD